MRSLLRLIFLSGLPYWITALVLLTLFLTLWKGGKTKTSISLVVRFPLVVGLAVVALLSTTVWDNEPLLGLDLQGGVSMRLIATEVVDEAAFEGGAVAPLEADFAVPDKDCGVCHGERLAILE